MPSPLLSDTWVDNGDEFSDLRHNTRPTYKARQEVNRHCNYGGDFGADHVTKMKLDKAWEGLFKEKGEAAL